MDAAGAGAGRPLQMADLKDGRRLTPMLRQFLDLKEQCPDALLLFRMGDFYELFFEDAQTAAPLLDLTLTARDKLGENPIPMAGVPHHAVRGYIRKLVELGLKVALADQVEDPKLARGIVKRAITEVITPGLITDPENLDARAANYLCALWQPAKGPFGLATIDVSTGEFLCTEIQDTQCLAAEFDRLAPREVLIPESLRGSDLISKLTVGLGEVRWTEVPDPTFDLSLAKREVCELFGVKDLRGFGLAAARTSLQAAGAVLDYLRSAHIDELGHVRSLRPYQIEQFMVLDEGTRKNLEIFRTLSERRRSGSLIGLLDKAVTPMGSRRLRHWLGAPLLDVEAIEARLSAVELLVQLAELREKVRDRLDRVHDIERLNGKVLAGRATARDLLALRRSLQQAPAVDILLDRSDARENPYFLPLPDLEELCSAIQRELEEDPPLGLKEGGLIRRGVHSELDELIELSREGKGALARLESQERRDTGIGSLKVRFNRVFGYYIEVTKANLKLVPEHYIRKQTLANAERYYTPELKDFEAKILGAEERRCALEFELFCDLRDRVAGRAADLSALAGRLAEIDALAALAQVAVQYSYVRPTLDEGEVLDIEAGRHPVVEQMPLGERFVPNDVRLDRESCQLAIISGPNMAGKSTVMRQVALIVLMAQSGSFVPAQRAHIGVVDRIFTRVGASDNLSRGQSTFMVEMSEAAAILHQATERSLAILDEIGRGTSTYDGVAIAWAVAEYIADTLGCRTMFATHYHELAGLAETREAVQNFNIAVSEIGGRVIFLRRLRPGGASRSYGIQVAKLAGLPEPVLERAREVLSNLERETTNEVGHPKLARQVGDSGPSLGQLALFGGRAAMIREELLKLDPERLTPLEAIQILSDLKDKAEGL